MIRSELCSMNGIDLARRLKKLRRTVVMLRSELQQGNMDDALLADIDLQLEQGLAMEPRSAELRDHVDRLRESTLNCGSEMFADTIRAADKLNDAIEGILDRIA